MHLFLLSCNEVQVQRSVLMTKTRLSIIRRMHGDVPARPVPKFVQDAIDIVTDLFRDDAFARFPRSKDPAVEEHNYWARLDYYKQKVMGAFLREYRTDALDRLLNGRTITNGMAAIFFHQYIAALKRSTPAMIDADCPLSIEMDEIQDADYYKTYRARQPA